MHSRSIPLRVLDELDLAIAGTADALQRQVLTAKRACAFARFSAISDATEEIKRLRQANESYNPRLTAWIIFCEALVEHFEHLDAHEALNRLKRAHAISVAIGDEELVSATHAWIANCQFMLGNSGAAIEQLERLFQTDSSIEPETLARSYLILGDLLSWSGQPETAKHWYHHARLAAVAYGDLAFQSSVLFNAASFHVAELTLRDCMGEKISADEIRLLLLEVDSASNLDKAIGKPYLAQLVPVLVAEASLLGRRFESAKPLLDTAVSKLETITPERLRPKIVAEVAWLYAKCGQLDHAASYCEHALSISEKCVDVDDLVVFHARLSEAFEICGSIERSREQSESLARCKVALRQMRSELQQSLNKVVGLAAAQQQKTR